MQETIVTPEMRSALGHETEPVVIEIDRTLIERFVEAVEDDSPLWRDEEKARSSPLGGITAPPSLLSTALAAGTRASTLIDHLLPQRKLDGGGDWEFFKPIRLGDSITVVSRLVDIKERQGRRGPMLLLTSEVTWRNQQQEVVAKARTTSIRF